MVRARSIAETYASFSELAENEKRGKDFRVRCRMRPSTTVVLAPHGGGIEPGTSEVAAAIAGDDLSFYAFEGIKSRRNGCLHITSTDFDEPRCVALVQASKRVLSIHGEGSGQKVVFLGGRDEGSLQQLRASLQQRGFSAKTHQNPALQGRDPANICNRGTSGEGVQLELSEGLRRSFFRSLSAGGRKMKTGHFRNFVAAVREAIA